MSKYKTDILRLRAEGKTYNQIVNELGCTKSTVCYYLGSDQASKTAARQIASRRVLNDYIRKVKEETPCVECGVNYPYYVMDFDHLEDDKDFHISQHTKITRSLERIKEEIDKCEIVCSNCHRKRSHQRLQANRPLGKLG